MSGGDASAGDPTRARTGSDGAGERIGSTALRSPRAAPWERFGQPSSTIVRTDRFVGTRQPSTAPSIELEDDGAETSGCHTSGDLTVAELIARVGGQATGRPSHHRAVPGTDPTDLAPGGTQQEHADEPDCDTVAHPSAPASELPLLGPIRHRRAAREFDSGDTSVPLKASDRKPPTRIGPKPTAVDPEPKRRRPFLLAGRSLAALTAVLALTLTGGAWQWSTSTNNRLNTVSALDPQSRDIVDPNAQFGDENFLIVGTDSRSGANADMGAGDTEDAGGSRSDTVMLVNIPASRKRVVAVSFPRDLAITPVKCEAWNPDTGAYGPLYDDKTGTWGSDMVYTETKLNSAFAFGGPKCLVKVIQKLSGLSINRFIAIDFAGFAKMVDALGGVEVCSTTPLVDDELGTVLAHSGRQLIDADTALKYVRARKVATEDNGDYGRIKRQQLFLSSLLRSLISSDTFFSLSKLNKVVNMFISDSYVDNVRTKELVDLGQSVQGMSAGHVSFVTVPTTGITDEDGNEPPRTTDMRALFDAIINDDPLPGENDQNATAAPTRPITTHAPAAGPTTQARPEQVQAVTSAPENITVQVSNATGKSGLAATATTELEQRGFNVLMPDDYPKTVRTTTVLFSPGNEQAAATVASTLANSKVERVTGIGALVQVVLGPDFRAVSAPPPTGSPVRVQVNRSTSSAPTKLPDDLSVTNAADTTCE